MTESDFMRERREREDAERAQLEQMRERRALTFEQGALGLGAAVIDGTLDPRIERLARDLRIAVDRFEATGRVCHPECQCPMNRAIEAVLSFVQFVEFK